MYEIMYGTVVDTFGQHSDKNVLSCVIKGGNIPHFFINRYK